LCPELLELIPFNLPPANYCNFVDNFVMMFAKGSVTVMPIQSCYFTGARVKGCNSQKFRKQTNKQTNKKKKKKFAVLIDQVN
jgi:hypothetical protein